MNPTIRRLGRLVIAAAAVAVAVGATVASGSARATRQTPKSRDVALELVGQVANSAAGVTPATSIQYGYVAYLRGLAIFNGEPQSESTALFTFYVATTTNRVTNNGPLRIISREGTMTLYTDPSANGSFSNPDSFRDGTPILVATLHQQVIIDTSTGAFTTLNVNTITSTARFSVGSTTVRLGEKGTTFRTVLSGHVSTTSPPSAYIAGYTIPGHHAG